MAKDSTAKIWSQLGKDFGSDLFFRASEPLKLNWEVVDYPCVSLGSAVGVWGIPLGKITQLHGKENCGKTFLAMLMAKATLEKYPGSEVVWIDAELSFDKNWARKIGLDPNRVIVVNTNNAAEAFTFLCGKINDKGKKVADGVLDLAARGELNIKLLVLDSIAQLVPPSEAGRALDSYEMASLARWLPKALRLLRPMLAKSQTAMICINQLRASMTPHTPDSYTGGNAYKYNLDFAIKLTPSTQKENVLLDEKGEKVGHLILANVEKSRGSVNKHTAQFFLDFTKGVVRQGQEVAELAAAYGVVERPNLQVWKYGEHTVRGKDAFFALLDGDAKLRAEIVEKVKKAKEEGRDAAFQLSEEAIALEGEKGAFSDDGEDSTED